MDNALQQLKQLPAALLPWYDANRRSLPWRDEVTPYRTWVSEIMLQQTRVAAVIPYFHRFMAAFPTVEALAEADTEHLMKLWEGLGYYSRARNLQTAARIVARRGSFPDTYEEVLALPGIGDYTAGAILSIAFGEKIPAVDGNVLRVASRITGSGDNILDTKTRGRFRTLMAEIMPADRPGAFNQALMDLGATVCLPNGEPLCGECPAQQFCTACLQSRQKELPVRISKTKRRTEEKTAFLLLRDGGEVALRQRPDTGRLAGLGEYPHPEGTLDEVAAAAQLAKWGVTPHRWLKRLRFHHIFTHIRWEITGYVVEVRGEGCAEWLWCGKEARAQRAVPSAFEGLTRELPQG